MVAVGRVALGVLVAVVGGGIGLRFARRQWAIRREIRDAESARAGSLPRGVVELEGRAKRADETFTSPLTGQECLAYRYEVEERQRHSGGSGESQNTWRTVVDQERAAPFYVEDDTGQAMVDAPAAEFRLERAYEFDSEDATAGTAEKVFATLTGRDADPDLPVREDRLAEMREADRPRRYYEHLILPDESVYVYGEAIPPGEVPSGNGGLGSTLAGVAGLAEAGESTSPVLGWATSALGGSEEFRRARRGDHDDRQRQPDRAEIEELREFAEQMESKDREELSQEDFRRFQELSGEGPMDLLGGGPGEAFTEGVSNAVYGETGSDGSPMAGERLVVSRGETIGEFVVSDREKSGVIRSYSTSTLKWVVVAVGALALGGGIAVTGLDGVAVGELLSRV